MAGLRDAEVADILTGSQPGRLLKKATEVTAVQADGPGQLVGRCRGNVGTQVVNRLVNVLVLLQNCVGRVNGLRPGDKAEEAQEVAVGEQLIFRLVRW